MQKRTGASACVAEDQIFYAPLNSTPDKIRLQKTSPHLVPYQSGIDQLLFFDPSKIRRFITFYFAPGGTPYDRLPGAT
jgi:hypothetical protein